MAAAPIDFSDLGGRPVQSAQLDFSDLGGTVVQPARDLNATGLANRELAKYGIQVGAPKQPELRRGRGMESAGPVTGFLESAVPSGSDVVLNAVPRMAVNARPPTFGSVLDELKSPYRAVKHISSDIGSGNVASGVGEAVGNVAGGFAAGALYGNAPREFANTAKRTFLDPVTGRAATGISEGVLGVTRRDRLHLADKQAIGQAALNELTATTPEGLLDQANAKIATLSQQLDDVAVKSTARVSLQPALDVLDDIIDRAERESSQVEANIAEKLKQQLSRRPSGAAIPTDITSAQLLDLKRGIGKAKNWGTPSEASLASAIVDRVYGVMNDQLEKAVPETGPINARLQALMGVAEKAEGLTNAPGVMQRAFGRLRAPTGALTSSTGVGAGIGFAAAGPPGAALGAGIGATVGPFATEAFASPTAWMGAARRINPSPFGRNTIPLSLLITGAVRKDRRKQDEQ